MTACLYFALCDRPAEGVVKGHPILKDIPSCQRCADRVGVDLELYGPARGTAVAIVVKGNVEFGVVVDQCEHPDGDDRWMVFFEPMGYSEWFRAGDCAVIDQERLDELTGHLEWWEQNVRGTPA